MIENRLEDYLDHMRQAATDACAYVEGLQKDNFLNDKRTQQAVTMSVIVCGEAATKIMESYIDFAHSRSKIPWSGYSQGALTWRGK